MMSSFCQRSNPPDMNTHDADFKEQLQKELDSKSNQEECANQHKVIEQLYQENSNMKEKLQHILQRLEVAERANRAIEQLYQENSNMKEKLQHILQRLEVAEKANRLQFGTHHTTPNQEMQQLMTENLHLQRVIGELRSQMEQEKQKHNYECEQMKAEITKSNKTCDKLRKQMKYQLNKTLKVDPNSENMNDPCTKSDVLQLFEKLTNAEWDKIKNEDNMSYENGALVIKAMFDAAEKEIQQKEDSISAIEIPKCLLTDDSYKNKLPEEIQREIKDHLRFGYYKSMDYMYQKMAMDASNTKVKKILQDNDRLTAFASHCFKVFCLMLLLTPKITADWSNPQGSPPVNQLEHVTRAPIDERTNVFLLWPSLKCQEENIKSAIVYSEEKRSSYSRLSPGVLENTSSLYRKTHDSPRY